MVISFSFEETKNPTQLASELIGSVQGVVEKNNEKRIIRVSPQDFLNARKALKIIQKYVI